MLQPIAQPASQKSADEQRHIDHKKIMTPLIEGTTVRDERLIGRQLRCMRRDNGSFHPHEACR